MKKKVSEILAEGTKRSVRCGCIGWASGYPRATNGIIGRHEGWVVFKCLNCERMWKQRENT